MTYNKEDVLKAMRAVERTACDNRGITAFFGGLAIGYIVGNIIKGIIALFVA